MKKLIIGVVSVWVIIIICFIVYGRLSDKQEGILNDEHEANVATDGPYIGKPLTEYVSPREILSLFIMKIDEGNYDEAMYLVEPNYSLHFETFDELKLWAPGELKKHSIDIPALNITPLLGKFVVSLKSGEKVEYTFELVELINTESTPQIKDWYIKDLNKVRIE